MHAYVLYRRSSDSDHRHRVRRLPSAASSTAALPQTQVIEGKLARVLSWYDNEWGFATRMSDTALEMAKFL